MPERSTHGHLRHAQGDRPTQEAFRDRQNPQEIYRDQQNGNSVFVGPRGRTHIFLILTLFVAGNSTQMTLIDMIFADFNSLSSRNKVLFVCNSTKLYKQTNKLSDLRQSVKSASSACYFSCQPQNPLELDIFLPDGKHHTSFRTTKRARQRRVQCGRWVRIK